ncbi:helix-turn-helix transcriptional regulator [Sphingomonas sp. BK036]|uniref:helix-turn-helix domain-containing protein n=1 Tax=Sphingomonas sp. BK036 TaxID=2512122 RepID=UPI001028AEA3|nr:helix-turn-helix transcriptional regulator [Sphingomonas sp. BK036]
MTLTPGQYLRTRREAAGLSIADVAERIATAPRWAQHLGRGWLAQIESDQMPASFNTIVVLHQVLQFDLGALVALSAKGVEAPRLCVVCACSEADRCVGLAGPCLWISDDRCSACAGSAPRSNTDAA